MCLTTEYMYIIKPYMKLLEINFTRQGLSFQTASYTNVFSYDVNVKTLFVHGTDDSLQMFYKPCHPLREMANILDQCVTRKDGIRYHSHKFALRYSRYSINEKNNWICLNIGDALLWKYMYHNASFIEGYLHWICAMGKLLHVYVITEGDFYACQNPDKQY